MIKNLLQFIMISKHTVNILKNKRKKIENTTHDQLLKPYLIGYTLKNNYNLKNVKFLQVKNV